MNTPEPVITPECEAELRKLGARIVRIEDTDTHRAMVWIEPIPAAKPRRFLVEIVPQKDEKHRVRSIETNEYRFECSGDRAMDVREVKPLTREVAYAWFLDTIRMAGYDGAPKMGAYDAFVARLKDAGMPVEGE